ncbi:MAG: hypothetical protein ACK4ZW_08385 [Blastomonas sp.]
MSPRRADPVILDDDAPQMEPQLPLVLLLCGGLALLPLVLVALS